MIHHNYHWLIDLNLIQCKVFSLEHMNASEAAREEEEVARFVPWHLINFEFKLLLLTDLEGCHIHERNEILKNQANTYHSTYILIQTHHQWYSYLFIANSECGPVWMPTDIYVLSLCSHTVDRFRLTGIPQFHTSIDRSSGQGVWMFRMPTELIYRLWVTSKCHIFRLAN